MSVYYPQWMSVLYKKVVYLLKILLFLLVLIPFLYFSIFSLVSIYYDILEDENAPLYIGSLITSSNQSFYRFLFAYLYPFKAKGFRGKYIYLRFNISHVIIWKWCKLIKKFFFFLFLKNKVVEKCEGYTYKCNFFGPRWRYLNVICSFVWRVLK